MSKHVCIVTGGSSGIGKCTAECMAEAGYTVYEFSRRESEQNGIFHVSCDVSDEQSVNCAVQTVFEREGRIDTVIHCAGFGISGAVEFTALSEAKKQFDVNFFGVVNVNHAVIPIMRTQGFGRLVMVSSVAGAIPIPFQTYYSCTKASINAYTMALANELRPFGITVSAVQPGDICTGFTAAREKNPAGDREYHGRISRSVSTMEHDEQNGMKPQTAGRFIAAVARRKSHKPIYTIGFTYKLFCILAKLLPKNVVNYLVSLLYAK